MLKIKVRLLKFIFIQIYLLYICKASAKSYTQCELSNELINFHLLTIDQAHNLTCIAQKFSRFNTNLIAGDLYGIFQINRKWCGRRKAGGECNIKCDSLLDDDITDDVMCAQKVIVKQGWSAWRVEKTQSCIKQLKTYAFDCSNKNHSSNRNYLHRDYCEYGTKLLKTYDISKIDALTWSCIAGHRNDTRALKSRNLNLREDVDQEVAACVNSHDVECSIKIQKSRNLIGFIHWPEYLEFCSNISEDEIRKCFGASQETKLNVFQSISTEEKKQFTTSTEVSIIVEEDQVTTRTVDEETTEYLAKTLEKPSSDSDDDVTIEGYSKVRLMFSDKNLVDEVKTTSEKIDEVSKNNLNNSTIQNDLEDIRKSTKCHITRSFAASGLILNELIPKFVCIAEFESGFNPKIIKQIGGKEKYGLFQIDNVDYCNTNEKINKCDVLCTHLLDYSFDNDLECAKYIYDQVGFNYWPSYSHHCTDVNSDLIERCRETHTTTHQPYTIVNFEALKKKYILNERLASTSTESTTISKYNDAIKIEDDQILSNDAKKLIKQYDICEFSQELYTNQNVLLNELVDYICIADQQSKIRIFEASESDNNFGIFGLENDSCGINKIDGKCSIMCSDLQNNDLHDDVRCMVKIYKEKSLSYWNLTDEICRQYNNKILKCIDEEKFVPIDNRFVDDGLNLKNFDEVSTKIMEVQNSTEEALKSILKEESLADKEKDEETEKIVFNNDKSNEKLSEMNSEIENLDERVRLLLYNTLDALLTMVAQNLTREEASSMRMTLNEMLNSTTDDVIENSDLSEKDFLEMEERAQIFLQNISKLVEADDTILEYSTSISNINDLITTTLATTAYLLNDRKISSENFSQSKDFSSEKINEISTESFEKFSINDEQIEIPSKKEKFVTSTEIPSENRKDSTISLINLRILNDKQQKSILLDSEEKIIDYDETTTAHNKYQTAKIVPEALLSDESLPYTDKTTTEQVYYTSVQEIIDHLQDLDEKNIIKRKTTQFEEDMTTELSSEEEMDEKEEFSEKSVTESFETASNIPLLKSEVVEKCALTRYIKESGKIPLDLLPTFICIAEHESGFNVTMVRSDGGKNRYMRYGFFQIDDNEYCNTNEIINKCDVLCAHLLDNQYDNDFECALDIYNADGFKYWPSYTRHCTNADSKLYEDCREVFTTTHVPFTPFDREFYVNDLYTTTLPTTTTVTIPTTTEFIPKFNYTDKDSRFVIKRFDLCELANEIYNYNVTIDELSKLLCIAGSKSDLKIRQPLESEEVFGIFSINKSFCDEGGICGNKCSDFFDEDISNDIECYKKLVDGFESTDWNLDEEECKPYVANLLNCIEEYRFATTLLPNQTSYTSWIGFNTTTEYISTENRDKQSEIEEEMTTAYYDNGVLTTIEILKSTQIPSTEKKNLPRDLLPPRGNEDNTETISRSITTDKPITLSILLEPPYDNENSEDFVETTTKFEENAEATSTNITQEELEKIVEEILMITDPLLPKETFSDDFEEEIKPRELNMTEPMNKSIEITPESSTEDEISTSEGVFKNSETTVVPLTTSQHRNHKIFEVLDQILVPPKESENEGGEEMSVIEKPSDFRIVVHQSTSSEEITEGTIMQTKLEEVVENEKSTKIPIKGSEKSTMTPIPPPMFRRRSNATKIQTLATERIKNEENNSMEITTLGNSLIINEELKSNEEIISEKNVEEITKSSKIIESLLTTTESDLSDKTKLSTLPVVILNNKNLKDQVETIINTHTVYESVKNSSSPLIFNIFNFNIDGQNHDVKYSIIDKDQKRP